MALKNTNFNKIEQIKEKRVLILGASGLLGSRLYIDFSNKYNTQGTSNTKLPFDKSIFNLDVTAPNLSQKIIDFNPNVVVNCIAFTDVDKCEAEKEYAWFLNAELPRILSTATKAIGAKFIHISTDHFEQMLNNEGQKIDTPVNFYGESKLAGEKYIQSINPEAIIVRTNFFGINFLKDSKKTFFDTLINSLSNNLKIKGFSNIYFTPISILELCKSLGVLMTCDLKGIVNICGNKRISKFQFCLEAAKVINCDSDLIIDTKFVPNSVFKKRPFDMSMDNSVYVKETGHQIPNYDKMLEKEYSLSHVIKRI
jgi:dTDP-4-dehydrorhamnose reductase